MELPRRLADIGRVDTLQVLSLIRDARFSGGVRCPRCGANPCPRWGTFNGRQRYRCHGCQRTFSDLTGTPAAYSKKLPLWWDYAHAMGLSVPVRKVAARLSIHPSTAFRWRHALLVPLAEAAGESLRGWTEVGSEWFPYSEKGSRNPTRPGRRRGLRDPWPDARLGVNVLLAADRLGHAVTFCAGGASGRRLYLQDLERGLTGRFAERPILTMPEGPLGPGARFAAAVGGEYADARGWSGGRTTILAHTRTVIAYARRLRGWMKGFRGVATRYLPNYLAWHLAIDQQIRAGPAAVLLRWPTGGEFP